MERAPVQHAVPAPRGGYVEEAGALAIGLAAVRLGAGRSRPGEAVDHAVGIVIDAKPGDAVEAGAPLATVHARDTASAEAAAADIAAAYRIGDAPVTVPDVLLETIA
jgi:thymidine phosphorylase